jgi:hypothetical protein
MQAVVVKGDKDKTLCLFAIAAKKSKIKLCKPDKKRICILDRYSVILHNTAKMCLSTTKHTKAAFLY